MSPEEAAREAEGKQRAEAEAQAEMENQQLNDVGRKSTSNSFAGAPTYQPPAPPGRGSGTKSPEEEETIRRAERIANKSEKHGHNEVGIPEITIRTSGSASTGIFPSIAAATAPSLGSAATQISHGRDPTHQPGLPIVDESGEALTNGNRGTSRFRHPSQISSMTGDSDGRPLTPAKDGHERGMGFGNPIMSNVREPRRGPPTPPKTSGSMAENGNGYAKRLAKPESADSGIGVHATGRERSGSQRSYSSRGPIGRESMDKALPPLPAFNRAA